jgi:alkanesulfonate monooxygenase SsuD/methylene tetrahydromethanopterin reductase-like flavin-dependent oxidoreductase (luciferase family)
MEFGLFFLMQRDEEWSEQAVYHSGLELMLAAEALGYSSVWIGEHHFNDYGLCPSPPVLAARGGLRAIEAPFMGYQRRMTVLRSDSTGGSVPGSFDRSLLRRRDFRDYLADGWALVGTPAEVRDGLAQYREATGYDRVLLVMALPGLDTELALRSMRLFAEQIAPVMIPA